MTYQNRANASVVRAMIRILLGLMAIVTAFWFLDTDERAGSMVGTLFGGMFVLLVLAVSFGGLHELNIRADNSVIEIGNEPILRNHGNTKTHTILTSNDDNRLLTYRHLNLCLVHYVYVRYIGHRGKEKKFWVGLTLMEQRKRKELLKYFEKAKAQKNESNS